MGCSSAQRLTSTVSGTLTVRPSAVRAVAVRTSVACWRFARRLRTCLRERLESFSVTEVFLDALSALRAVATLKDLVLTFFLLFGLGFGPRVTLPEVVTVHA